jgi:hypothetical protein
MKPERRSPLEEALKDPLPGVRKQLKQEYEQLPEQQIDKAARHGLERLSGARVREFVPILAWRHAREHLRKAS